MIRTLLIEDNPADAKLVEHYLKEAFENDFSLVNATYLSEGLKYVSNAKFDIIITDLALPDSIGLQTFTTVHTAVSDIPIVVLTGNKDESLGVEAVKSGAADFLNKNKLDSAVLKRSIVYSIERQNLQNRLIEYSKKLEAKEKQLEEVQRLVHIGNWDLDLTTNIITWSDEIYRMHGIAPERTTMSLDKTEEWVLPEDVMAIKKQLKDNLREAQTSFENGKKEHITPLISYRILLPDGQVRILLSGGKITADEEGKPKQMIGTVQDITFLKAAEMKLREDNVQMEKEMADCTREIEQLKKKLQYELGKKEKTGVVAADTHAK